MKNQVFNPYLPLYEYIPDGEPRVFGDRLYVYGSHDRFGSKDYCMNDYACYSAPLDDLSQWRFDGYIYQKSQEPLNTDADKIHSMYAPDVVQGKDGRYYLYYGLGDFINHVSVAVCDEPAGKFEYYGAVSYEDGTPIGDRDGDEYHFDPGVLVDDNKIWLYTGFSPDSNFIDYVTAHFDNLKTNFNGQGSNVLELADDMKTVISVSQKLVPGWVNSKGTGFEDHEFFEASSIRKIDDRYYFIYSSKNNHELCYAVSDYPDHGFVYAGILHSNGDIGYKGNTEAKTYWGNNHGSLVNVKGQYYIFGHRQTGYTEYSRQGVAEKIERRADGLFDMAELTSCGLNDGPLRGTGYYDAGIACNLWSKTGAAKAFDLTFFGGTEDHPCITQSGEDREGHADQYITNLQAGSFAGFKYFDLVSPTTIEVEVRGKGTGKMLVRTSETGKSVAEISLSTKEDWHNEQASFVKKIEGVKPLYFEYQGDETIEFRGFTLK